jgi:hypothetical protein
MAKHLELAVLPLHFSLAWSLKLKLSGLAPAKLARISGDLAIIYN